MSRRWVASLVVALCTLGAIAVTSVLSGAARAADDDAGHGPRATRSGPWSAPATWADHRVPGDGDQVVIEPGVRVTYDIQPDDSRAAQVIRDIHVAGTLTFARDRSTLLNVGVITIGGRGDHAGVHDVDDHDHGDHAAPDLDANPATHSAPDDARPALELGTTDDPIPHPHTATIRLHFLDGFDPTSEPAIICRPGGRMDYHGAPMNRTWVELGADAAKGATTVTLAEAVTGWSVGDTLLITGTGPREEGRGGEQRADYLPIHPTTEQRIVTAIDGVTVTLDAPLDNLHLGTGDYRGEVANLSRNVVVESANPDGDRTRGHTMYHRYAAGSISYARFAHLGKRDTLGRYPIHFHRVRDTLRGSSVIGAAIVDSHNRWITIHGTQYMVVRDCVGYRAVGHGFFLEDGTEEYNTLDRNLGVQALRGPHMKGQALPFDPNDGAAFWWANGRNSFTRNVACENHEYGYRYDSQKRSNFDSNLGVRQPDGSTAVVDIRTLPIWRFSDNESHTEGLYSFVFAGTDGVGPDTSHPHHVDHLTAWNTHYALRAQLPTMLVEHLDVHDAAYGVYRPWFDHHVYRDIRIADTDAEPFNRGLDDESTQHGPITVDGLTFAGRRYGRSMPFIQISDNNVTGKAVTHIRHVTAPDAGDEPYKHNVKPLVNRGGGLVVPPKTPTGVPIYLHDYYGAGRHAKIVSTAAKDFGADGLDYHADYPLTGDEARVAEVSNVEFPTLLTPVDDQPPVTVVTWPTRGVPVRREADGSLTIRGTTSDNVSTARVVVNGVEARDVDYNFYRWSVTLKDVKPGVLTIRAHAIDAAGNVEQTPQELSITVAQ
ncbi:MAG: hypothetical protein GC159_03100 [Phycisphaera sp.]|nr:hypothetical protein [Phycisphaera sp.]